MSGAHVLCPQLLQDGRSTPCVIADEFYLRLALDCTHKLGRKFFEGSKRLLDDYAGDFPVTSRRIFAGGAFLHFAEARQIRLMILRSWKIDNLRQSEFAEIRQ